MYIRFMALIAMLSLPVSAYAAEGDDLRAVIVQLQSRIDELEARLAALEASLDSQPDAQPAAVTSPTDLADSNQAPAPTTGTNTWRVVITENKAVSISNLENEETKLLEKIDELQRLLMIEDLRLNRMIEFNARVDNMEVDALTNFGTGAPKTRPLTRDERTFVLNRIKELDKQKNETQRDLLSVQRTIKSARIAHRLIATTLDGATVTIFADGDRIPVAHALITGQTYDIAGKPSGSGPNFRIHLANATPVAQITP